jgi:hypothetical protein
MSKSKNDKRDRSTKRPSSNERLVVIACYKVCKAKPRAGEAAAWERFATGGKYLLTVHSSSSFDSLEAEIRKGLKVDDFSVFHDARLAGVEVEKDRLVLRARQPLTPCEGQIDILSDNELNCDSSSDDDDSGSDSSCEDDDDELPGAPLADVAAAAQRYINDQVSSIDVTKSCSLGLRLKSHSMCEGAVEILGLLRQQRSACSLTPLASAS